MSQRELLAAKPKFLRPNDTERKEWLIAFLLFIIALAILSCGGTQAISRQDDGGTIVCPLITPESGSFFTPSPLFTIEGVMTTCPKRGGALNIISAVFYDNAGQVTRVAKVNGDGVTLTSGPPQGNWKISIEFRQGDVQLILQLRADSASQDDEQTYIVAYGQ